MKIGLVQHVVGSVGGNDMVLDAMIETLHDHDLTLYTFSKIKKDGIRTVSKVPFKIRFFGLYQNLLRPRFDLSGCDLVISTTGSDVDTDRPLVIYDQNNLGLQFGDDMPEKYNKGFWRLYYLPYKKFLNKRINPNARYVCNSKYSARMLAPYTKAEVVYPGVRIDGFIDRPKKNEICMVGRISPEKNLEHAVNILNNVRHDSWILGSVTKPNMPYYHKLDHMSNDSVHLGGNIERNIILKNLSQSKVYFSSAKETFGIATIEAIASGCIPIVPDNSAHPETVPFAELRYDGIADAVQKIDDAMNGKHDHLIPRLKEHIRQFDIGHFRQGVLSWLR